MTVPVRTLDDGAWISVNNARAVSNSAVWPVAGVEFCDCEVAHLLPESFYDVSVDRDTVAVGTIVQCIDCGGHGTIDALPVGRVVNGEFREFDTGAIRSPAAGDQ
ncbi:hypothetical protein [Halostella salina]|uniref:hypothetical protein n=1 Tax=Halostella salina TaxID=1547897 RepID=UPI000EF85316|nr:hypothetical protein [Halostella salina]